MLDTSNNAPCARVVACLRAAETAPLPAHWLRVPTAYEAAAELLAAPAEALVADLRLLDGRLRLLEIARDLDVRTVGFGAMPDAASLDGLLDAHLPSSAGLDEAVAAALQAPAVRHHEPHDAPTVRLAPAKLAEAQEPDRENREQEAFGEVTRAADEALEAEEPTGRGAQAEAAPAKPAARRAIALDARDAAREAPRPLGPGPLSEDELAALLENDS